MRALLFGALIALLPSALSAADPARLKITWTHSGLNVKQQPITLTGFQLLFDGVEVARADGAARELTYTVPAGKCVPRGTGVSLTAMTNGTDPADPSKTVTLVSTRSATRVLSANHCTGEITIPLSVAPEAPVLKDVAQVK